MYFEIWSGKLRETVRGRIWWNHYCFDKAVGNLPARIIAEFENGIEGQASIPVDYYEVLAAFDAIACCRPWQLDQCCPRRPAVRPGSYSRILTAKECSDFLIDWDLIGLEEDERTDETLWDRLGTLVSPRHYHGILRTRRHFFWATSTDPIDDIRAATSALPGDSGSSKLADELVIRLGLGSMIPGSKLLEVKIPSVKIVAKTVCAPTTLDAGVSNIFFIPSRDPAGIGWTRNLIHGREDLQEVLIEEVEFDRDYPSLEKVGMNSFSVPVLDIGTIESQSEDRLANI